MRILLVENDPIIGLNSAAELTRAGHQVIGPAISEAEAQAMASAERPDLALLDINLDGDDEGVRLARSFGEERVPCLFVSGSPAVARANRDAALGVLTKPYEAADLTGSVDVAEAISLGHPNPRCPRGLELFRNG